MKVCQLCAVDFTLKHFLLPLVDGMRAQGWRVTAVCSRANIALMHQLGAARVMDYTRDDFADDGIRYDVIADVVGTAPYTRVQQSLAPSGRLLLVLATLPEMLRAPWISATTPHRVIAGPSAERAEDVRTLVTMASEGRFSPLIDSSYPLRDIAAAHARVETGHKRGSVVVINDA